jgi:hypothetical protein
MDSIKGYLKRFSKHWAVLALLPILIVSTFLLTGFYASGVTTGALCLAVWVTGVSFGVTAYLLSIVEE